jgi:hypothetical protein
MRRRGDFFMRYCDTLSDHYGCYLGEAMIARHGGEWHVDEEHAVSIVYEDNVRFFPLTKVAKLLKSGLEGGESILAFYSGVPKFIEMVKRNGVLQHR